MSTTDTQVRNATLDDIVTILRGQHARKLDLVAPVVNLYADGGQLVVTGAESVLEEDGSGVTDPNGGYLPTGVADDGIARIFNVPQGYFRRLRNTNTRGWDNTVNDWLDHDDYINRKYLLRTFRGSEGDPGVARAVLSDSYGIIDHLDALMATIDGINEAGVKVEVERCDLSDSKLYVAFRSDKVTALAPKLLEAYRSPFEGPNPLHRVGRWDLRSGLAAAAREGQAYDGGTEPIVSAGFALANSETGLGRYTLSPRIVARICRNGLVITEDGIARQHLGQRLDEGLVVPSRRTQRKLLELITAQTADAVTQWLQPDWLAGKIAKLEALSGAEVTDPQETVKALSKKLSYGEDRQKAILDAFLRGGQPTAGGLLNAVTAIAQTLADPDEAYRLESDGVKILELAATAR